MSKTIYTNKHNYPDIVYDAITNDDYDYTGSENSISVTSLLKTPRIRKYTLDPDIVLEQDVSESVWILLGKAVHYILQQAGSHYIKEQRIEHTIDNITLSGKYDFYDYKHKILGDFKITSKYNQEAKTEWEQQLNILKYLVEKTIGLQIEKLQIIAIARDFMLKDTFSTQFADTPLIPIDIPIWDTYKTELFIRNRLLLHKNYKDYICTETDKWTKPKVYAVTKPNASRATKLCANIFEATDYISNSKDKNYIIQERPQVDVFCQSYCPVRKVCEINKELSSNI